LNDGTDMAPIRIPVFEHLPTFPHTKKELLMLVDNRGSKSLYPLINRDAHPKKSYPILISFFE
jgi:hypothetical protein